MLEPSDSVRTFDGKRAARRKERLGHGSLRTTERYLHTLPDADETALDALAKVRNRRSAG